MFTGIYGVFTGKSECRNFKFTRIVKKDNKVSKEMLQLKTDKTRRIIIKFRLAPNLFSHQIHLKPLVALNS